MRSSRTVMQPVRVMRVIARLNIGGPAIHVALLTARMNAERFASTLVTGQISPTEGDMTYLVRDMGITPLIIPELGREISLLDDLKAFVSLVRLIREERPQIVDTHTAKAGLLGRTAAFVCGVPVIIHTFHGHVFEGYFSPLESRVFIWLERLAGLMSSAIVTISEGLRDDLIAYRIAPASKIRAIPLGLDVEPLASGPRRQGALRRELAIRPDAPLIGIVGRLVPIKNHELFLAAAQVVAESTPQAHFVVVGDGERRAELERLAVSLGLQSHVHFTGWRRDLATIYSDLDLLALTSRNEGTPMSLIEAMAAGVPVVATAVGGVPDVLRGGELGVLVPSGDPAALVEAMLAALRGDSENRTVRARQWVLAQYGADRLISDTRKLYDELLAAKGLVSQLKP